jgi:AraC family transcriptional regulator
LTIVPPGTAITWRVNGGVHSFSLHLSKSCFGGLGEATSKSVGKFLPFRCGIQDPVLASLVSALADELASPCQIGPIYGESLADSIGLYMARGAMLANVPCSSSGGLSPQDLRVVLDTLEAHLGCGISLQALADSIDVSRAFFARSFRRSMGITPHAYMTKRRIELAKDLLRSSQRTICDIALSSGFASQAHFTAQFRRETGQTPSRYRSLGN